LRNGGFGRRGSGRWYRKGRGRSGNGRRRKFFQQGAGIRKEGATSIFCEDVVQDLAGCFGAIFGDL